MNIHSLRRQLRCSYLYSFVLTLNITGAVWVALLAARGYSLWQIGAAEGIFHVVSLLAGVPIPEKTLDTLSVILITLLLSYFTLVFGELVPKRLAMKKSESLAMGLSALAYNLVSGSQEALVYDSLKEADQTDQFFHVQTVTTQVETAGAALGKLAGALTGVLSFTGFYLADTVIGLLRTAGTRRHPRTGRPAGGAAAYPAGRTACQPAHPCDRNGGFSPPQSPGGAVYLCGGAHRPACLPYLDVSPAAPDRHRPAHGLAGGGAHAL